MQPRNSAPASDLVRPLRHNLLSVSPERLGALALAGDGLHSVIVPKADEEAWEGTEIDVRRTVL